MPPAPPPGRGSIVLVAGLLVVGLGLATQVLAPVASPFSTSSTGNSPSAPPSTGGGGGAGPGNGSGGGLGSPNGTPGGPGGPGSGGNNSGSNSTGTSGGNTSGSGAPPSNSSGNGGPNGTTSNGTAGNGTGGTTGNGSTPSGNNSGTSGGPNGSVTGGGGTAPTPPNPPPKSAPTLAPRPPLSLPWSLIVLILVVAAAVVSAIVVGLRQSGPGRVAHRSSPTQSKAAGGAASARAPTGSAADGSIVPAAPGETDPRSTILREYGRFLAAVERRRLADVRPLTPKEVVRVTKSAWSGAERRLDELRERFELARYSPHPVSSSDAEQVCRTVVGLIGPAAAGGRAG